MPLVTVPLNTPSNSTPNFQILDVLQGVEHHDGNGRRDGNVVGHCTEAQGGRTPRKGCEEKVQIGGVVQVVVILIVDTIINIHFVTPPLITLHALLWSWVPKKKYNTIITTPLSP